MNPPKSTRDTAPCKGCTERYLTCHDKCEKYKAWKAEVFRVEQNRTEYRRKKSHFN